MEAKLFNQKAEEIGNIDLPNRIFKIKVKDDLVHQALVTQEANSRMPIAHTKDRREAHGGGRKPWQQKGTGRARHGSIRSPIWKGGGVTFGPRNTTDYSKKMNKKARRLALFMVLSSKLRDNQLLVVDDIKLEASKTKSMNLIVNKLSSKFTDFKKSKKKQDKILIAAPGVDDSLVKATKNLPFTSIIRADSLNIKDVLEKKYLILLKDSIELIEKTFSK